MEDQYNKSMKGAFTEIGKALIAELTKQLLNADKKASGKLIRSLDYKVIEQVNGLLLQLRAAPYLKYVDQGVNGTRSVYTTPYGFRGMISVKAIKPWIKARGIKFKGMTDDQAAFVIARSIGRKGIKPTNVIKKSIDNIFNNKKKLLERAAITDIEDMINKIMIGKK